jgi:hypothetical protein
MNLNGLSTVSYLQQEPHESGQATHSLKGTHARDFLSLFFNFFFASFNHDTKRSTANIFENLLQICPDVQNFLSLPVLAESIAERCHQKQGVKCSIVFVTVCFLMVLSIFGEKAESNFAFSAKAWS